MAFSSFFEFVDIPRLEISDKLDPVRGTVILPAETRALERIHRTFHGRDLEKTVFILNTNDERWAPRILRMYGSVKFHVQNPREAHPYFSVAYTHTYEPQEEIKAMLEHCVIFGMDHDHIGFDFSVLENCRQITFTHLEGQIVDIRKSTRLHTLVLYEVYMGLLEGVHPSVETLCIGGRTDTSSELTLLNLPILFPNLQSLFCRHSRCEQPLKFPSLNRLELYEIKTRNEALLTKENLPNLKHLVLRGLGYGKLVLGCLKEFEDIDFMDLPEPLDYENYEVIDTKQRGVRRLHFTLSNPYETLRIDFTDVTDLELRQELLVPAPDDPGVHQYIPIKLGEIFDRVTKLEKLKINGVAPESVIELEKWFPHLKELDLSLGTAGFVDTSEFAYLDKVCLRNYRGDNLVPLSGCREVGLYLCPNVTSLNALENVAKVDVRLCRSVNDVSKLGRVPHLNLIGLESLTEISGLGISNEEVNLTSTQGIRDYSMLASVPRVIVAKCKNIVSFERNDDPLQLNTLAQLASVPYLDISHCQQVTSTKPLKGTRWLKAFGARGLGLENLEGCEDLWGLSARTTVSSIRSGQFPDYLQDAYLYGTTDPVLRRQFTQEWHKMTSSYTTGCISDIRPLKDISILNLAGHRWFGVKGKPEKPWSIDPRINGASYVNLQMTLFNEDDLKKYFGKSTFVINSQGAKARGCVAIPLGVWELDYKKQQQLEINFGRIFDRETDLFLHYDTFRDTLRLDDLYIENNP